VIWIQSERAEELARKIKSDLGVDARAIEGAVRVEKERGHEFLPQLATRYAADIQSLTLAKPSLEDVFIHKTGHRFWKI
jgi:ABC-2 type transport system ATP-binding protein